MVTKKFNVICLNILFAFTLPACSSKTNQVNQLLQNSRNNMVFVQGSTFIMGEVKYQGQTYDQGAHSVTLSSYYMSKDNISYGEYDTYTQSTNQPYIDDAMRKIKYFGRAANFPVSTATWNQAHDYCAWLAKETGQPYALPTEAQWEYAARKILA